MSVAGLLLAAGAGHRRGAPKALALDADETSWLRRSLDALAEGGCDPVVVVLGAGTDQARALVPDGVEIVVADDWAEGMGASLRVGLRALSPAPTTVEATLVSLVDLPDVGADVVSRLLASRIDPHPTAELARAAYDGVPGHPVLLGRDHWDEVAASVVGDRGARDYLAARAVRLVECGDLASGVDDDLPPDPQPSR